MRARASTRIRSRARAPKARPSLAQVTGDREHGLLPSGPHRGERSRAVPRSRPGVAVGSARTDDDGARASAAIATSSRRGRGRATRRDEWPRAPTPGRPGADACAVGFPSAAHHRLEARDPYPSGRGRSRWGLRHGGGCAAGRRHSSGGTERHSSRAGGSVPRAGRDQRGRAGVGPAPLHTAGPTPGSSARTGSNDGAHPRAGP
jgi:hypothetical protein